MFKLYNHNYDDRLEQMMNGNCSDCGEQYELDALDLDLRCADCIEQWAIDLRQKFETKKVEGFLLKKDRQEMK